MWRSQEGPLCAGHWSLRKRERGMSSECTLEEPGHETEKGGPLLLGRAGRHSPGILGAALSRQKCSRADIPSSREKQHPKGILGSL